MRRYKVNTTYRRPDGTMQPTCRGISKDGKLRWHKVPKAPWHLKMFPNKYDGDFAVAWMYASLYSQGYDWSEEE